MIPDKPDYAIENSLKTEHSSEQKALQELTGKSLPQNEAKTIWRRIQDHKWYISERLRRDVGLRVAAIDYIENFYEPGFANAQKLTRSLAVLYVL